MLGKKKKRVKYHFLLLSSGRTGDASLDSLARCCSVEPSRTYDDSSMPMYGGGRAASLHALLVWFSWVLPLVATVQAPRWTGVSGGVNQAGSVLTGSKQVSSEVLAVLRVLNSICFVLQD